MRKIITSESVNIGHSDKCCDLIADSFLDEALRQDPNAMMAVECCIKDDLLCIYGEATTTAKIDYVGIANQVLKDIGYKQPFRIIQQISQQSKDINQAVLKDELCANDQGIVYGYACSDTKELMPLPIMLAHKLMQQYEKYRQSQMGAGVTPAFFADAKSQVSVEYNENDKPKALHTVLISASHAPHLEQDEINTIILEQVIKPVIANYKEQIEIDDCNIIVNPSGKFTIWGSNADSGCVGRKIVVDTYGGVGRVGGGCFSSKNATKVDRSGAYYARFVAKNIVAHGLATKCEIQVAYGIGLAEPISLNIDCFGSGQRPQAFIENWVHKHFDFRPSNIIRELDLLKPIYKDTACYGHFGREHFAWEQIKDIKEVEPKTKKAKG